VDTSLEDDEPRLDPLVIGLTRPPLMLGVPYVTFIVESVVIVMVFLNTKNLLTFGLIAPLHSIAYALTIRDVRFIEIIQKRLSRCPRTRNAAFWGGDSYAP
jgi:type IV secretion system protein VirB3